MARIKIPGKHDEIVIFDGEQSITYKHENGEIVVDDAHVPAVLASLPGSQLVQEAPAKKEK